MIVFTMTDTTKAAMVAALAAHGTDRLAVLGLGRVQREDSALATGAVMAAWPMDQDGLHRVHVSDDAGYIAWRAFIIAEIAAGRGLREKLDGYREALGIETRPAYDYVCLATKGLGIRPCKDADHDEWSTGTTYVVLSGAMTEPRKRWAKSAWHQRAKAHEALVEAGLAVPGRNTWYPQAYCLFDEPKRVVPAPTLSPAEDDALSSLAA